jgi:hypothetical protein
MRLRKQRPAAAPTTKPSKPQWQEHLDSQERPTREDRNAEHTMFADSLLEPVDMPRWVRGKRRRGRQDKLSGPR